MQCMKPNSTRRGAIVLLVAGLLVVPAGGLTAQRSSAVPAEADAQTVLHVLNRAGFGPTPGEVERVQQLGLATYIEQQLHPERLADKAVDARLADFATLSMSSRQLANADIPAQELRRQQQSAEGAPCPRRIRK